MTGRHRDGVSSRQSESELSVFRGSLAMMLAVVILAEVLRAPQDDCPLMTTSCQQLSVKPDVKPKGRDVSVKSNVLSEIEEETESPEDMSKLLGKKVTIHLVLIIS